jgi:cysteine desulfurase / selenocysteine lyase
VFYSTPAAREQLKLTQFGWHMMKDTHNYENKPWEIHPTARRFECGSPNMIGIHALSASLSLLLEIGMATVETLVLENAERVNAEIAKNEQLMLITSAHSPLKSGIVVFKHHTIANDVLYKQLQDNGVVCALRGGGIRFSPHFYNTPQDIAKAFSVIASLA